MLSYFRRAGRLSAPVAVVLALLVLLGTTDWWHANDTEDFVPAAHDHASHHPLLTTPRSSDTQPSEHCYLCHWLRSFQNGLRAATAHRSTGAEIGHVQPTAISALHDAAASILPARAPPV